jgi:DNA polymerase-3 subunit alpha
MLMHTIFCFVCVKVKTNDTNRSWSWLSVRLPNQEYYFKTGGDENSLLTCLKRFGIYRKSWIKLKYTIWHGRFYYPNLIFQRSFRCRRYCWWRSRGENAYLRHLTYEGANRRYPEITEVIRERLDFELLTISNSGYPGYFWLYRILLPKPEVWVFR